MEQNLTANPGPTYKELGFEKKRDSLALAWDIAKKVWDKAETEPVIGYLKPRYSLAGRSTIATKEKFKEKDSLGKKFGRTVWMADQHESLLAGAFSAPVLTYFHERMQVIANGFNKFSEDPKKIVEKLKKYNIFINSDFSGFDDSLGPAHFRRGFDILRHMYGVERGKGDKYDNLLDWLEDELEETLVVTPNGRVVKIKQGMPSGSGLTALLDSIINSAMWFEAMKALKIDDFHMFIQGDDNLLGVTGPRDSQGRGNRHWARRLLKRTALIFSTRFGCEMNPSKSKIGNILEVGIAQPKVPEVIKDGSSAHIANYRQELSEKLGRRPNFSEKFDELDEEPIGPAPGMTHRWTYLFSGRVPFLSHYFKRDISSPDGAYMTIRPTAEVVLNLLYPEGKCNTVYDHFSRLMSALVENMGNHHVVNRIMHYYYDAWLYEKEGYFRRRDMLDLSYDTWLNRRRAWYRKLDIQVDLLECDPEFACAWREFYKSAQKAHSSVFGLRYADWTRIRALRRGNLKTGLGVTLQREVCSADLSSTLGNRSVREALGPFGLGVWAKPELRQELSNQLLIILEESHFSRAAEKVALFKTRVERLRAQFIADG
jgi:hypothetical protein